MLAKEIKIKTLRKQREFIEKQLSLVDIRNDGDSAYSYVGHVYPEVIVYFQSEGFNVTKVENDMITAMNKGLPTYLFVVSDVELTEEELQQAEDYKPEKVDHDINADVPSFFSTLMGRDNF